MTGASSPTIVANIFSLAKEGRDLINYKDYGSFSNAIDDSIKDMIANWYGQVAAFDLIKSCENLCRSTPTAR